MYAYTIQLYFYTIRFIACFLMLVVLKRMFSNVTDYGMEACGVSTATVITRWSVARVIAT